MAQATIIEFDKNSELDMDALATLLVAIRRQQWVPKARNEGNVIILEI